MLSVPRRVVVEGRGAYFIVVDTRNLEVRSQKRAVGEDYIIIYGLLYGNQYIYI